MTGRWPQPGDLGEWGKPTTSELIGSDDSSRFP